MRDKMIEIKTEKKDGGAWKRKITRFLTAQTVSLLGSSLVQYAIVWHITITTASGAMMAVSTLCGFLPQLFISLFAGVWIDRYDRRKLIMLSDSVIALATLALALLFLTGHESIWLLWGALAVRSAGAGVQTPAVSALIPQLVPRESLMRINGINSAIQSLMLFLSPALSGLILSVLGIEATFFVDVITAFAGVGITAGISIAPLSEQAVELEDTERFSADEKEQERGKGDEEQNRRHDGPENRDRGQAAQLREMKRGLTYIKENPSIRELLLFQLAVLVLISPSAFLTPLLVGRAFGMEVWRLTLSEMTFSAGAAAGGVLIAVWGGFSSRIRTASLAAGCYGLLMIALGAAPVYSAYLLANLFIGITMPCYNAPVAVYVQEKVEPFMHGRVFSLMQITTSCALPLGMVLFGPLADLLPIRSLFWTAGTLVILCALISLRRMETRRSFFPKCLQKKGRDGIVKARK